MLKLVFISDTHGLHHQLQLPQGDVILHAGDVSSRGTEKEIIEFLEWFGKLDYQHKIFIAGNHDFFFENGPSEKIAAMIPPSVNYLNDSGITIEGIKIWGSPITPWFFDWAFNRKRGEEIKKHWDLIPENTDILVTHGPVHGILDDTIKGEAVGCKELLKKIKETTIQLHVFGHIHESYGKLNVDGVQYVNASVLDIQYRQVNPPVLLEFHKKISKI